MSSVPGAKRALSLDDLVNHDEDDKNKLQKLAENTAEAPADDETDTDDDVKPGSGGGINFGAGMTFDYDKQEDDGSSSKVAQAAQDSDTDSGEEQAQKGDTKHTVKQEDVVTKEKPAEVSVPSTKLSDEVSAKTVDKIFDEQKISTKSKRNNIKKDLEVLSEITAHTKPSKYKDAPIWAQKWRPTVKALQNIDITANNFKIDNSILNIIPDDDLTKSVQDWVYATIFSITPDLRPFVEMELKYGILLNGKGPDRINPPISSQAIYTELDAHMTPTIDETLFNELNKYIRNLSELRENEGKFNIIESHSKDSVYRVGLSTQRPRFLRMSTDMNTGRVGQFIEKRHIAQLLVYSPKDSYDMKLSISLELPVPENEPPEKYKDQTPINERTKERTSYIHNDSCTRFDITKVGNHRIGAREKDIEYSHEVELEINTPALLSAFDNIATDSKEYASLIRTFLNNGTIIRRKLTSLSYEIFEGQKKVM